MVALKAIGLGAQAIAGSIAGLAIRYGGNEDYIQLEGAGAALDFIIRRPGKR